MKNKTLKKEDTDLQDCIERKNKVQSEIDKLDMFVLTSNISISDFHTMLDKSFKLYFDSFDPIS